MHCAQNSNNNERVHKNESKKWRKIDLDTTKKDDMAVETTEERNQNLNGRNDGDRDTIEEQKLNDIEKM